MEEGIRRGRRKNGEERGIRGRGKWKKRGGEEEDEDRITKVRGMWKVESGRWKGNRTEEDEKRVFFYGKTHR